MEENNVVQCLAALAQPVRLRVFRTLVVAGPEGRTPGALVEELGVPATSMSFHLKELTIAGLLTQERNGRYLVYRVAFGQITALMAYLTENCCAGEACEVSLPIQDAACPC